MRLKKLVAQGYKTFASKTEFVFDSGITAVVGPNGSGKSNVSDAVRWVLGEQSFSTLRGKKTTDMIFSGSKTRARAGMASAVLTLDNTDGWLPIDYTEVEICRRAFRSGENEYLLNGQKVRLKDISDLLAKAGLAEQTYTIIGQGLIDKALSLKSDERRALFEEAAGISHYKSKRASSLRKLQDTQRNLQRVHDILSELKPRLSSLQRQANRAKNYTQIQTDLRDMLRVWYGFQWEKSKKETRERRLEAELAEKKWTAERTQFLEKQDEIDGLRNAGRELEEGLQILEERRESLRERLEQTRREVAILTERRGALERQLAESKEDLPLLTSQKEGAQQELALALSELETVQNEVKAEQAELATFEKSFKERQTAIDEATRLVRQFERAERESQNRLAQRQGQLAQLEERLKEGDQGGQSGDGKDIVTLQEEDKKLQGLYESAQSSAQELRTQRSALRSKEQDLEKEIKQRRRKLDEARRALNKTNTEMARLQARVEMLAQNRQAEQTDLPDELVLGRIADFIEIPDAYKYSIRLALAARLDAYVVPGRDALQKVIGHQQDDTALAALAVDYNPNTEPPNGERAIPTGAIGWADRLVSLQNGPDPLVAQGISRLLRSILVTEGDETALELQATLPADCCAVSQNGVIAYANGLVDLPRRDEQLSALAREKAFQDAEAALAEMEDRFSENDERVATEQKGLRDLNHELDTTSKERRRLGGIFAEAEQRANKAQRNAERVAQQIAFIERQRSGRQAEIEKLKDRVEQLRKEIGTEKEKLEKTTADLAEARSALDALPVGEAKQQRVQLQQQISGKRSILDGRRAIVDSRRATLNQLEKQISRIETRRREWSNQLLQMNLNEAVQALDKLEAEMTGLNQEIKPLRAELQGILSRRRAKESELAPLQKVVHSLETQYTQTKIALTQRETKTENLKERIKSELGVVQLAYDDDQVGDTPLPIEEVVEQLPQTEEVPAGMEEAIQKMRSQLSRMGAVNPDAPAEYESVRERHDFLETQVEDLNQTEVHLRQVIDELDELTSKAFAETVVKVNTVFGKMFTRLFGGGAAELELTDPDDLTVSGVDIIAQLPGRRPQGLALLSGGERSLTAASLIFALLKVSPTPFCVMDEVDAALDEANVNRFREVLMELSDETQFIVITHNRGTVQAAQAIYGITMGTDSTSQVISIKPEEYLTQARLMK